MSMYQERNLCFLPLGQAEVLKIRSKALEEGCMSLGWKDEEGVIKV